jgi:hypothetical protein
MRRKGVRGFIAFAALASVLAIMTPSHATTVPLPKGVVVGQETYGERCDEYNCRISFGFKTTKIVGRLGGVQVVASATFMSYVSFQYYCPYSCPPTQPTLASPFSISGTTAARAPFTAICTSGAIVDAFPDEQVSGMPMVTARCQGGTPASSGAFALKFLVPAIGVAGPFVGILVEA